MANDRTIAFIGGGNMAASLIGGLLEAGWDPETLAVGEPDEARRGHLVERFGVTVTGDNAAAVKGAATVVLAVKPQAIEAVAGELGRIIRDDHPLVISVAAGIRLEKLRHWLGVAAPLVRVMPNTPALVGSGVSALYAGDDVDGPGRAEAERILRAAGEVVWVPKEAHMDTVTGVSGSGPAYFFLILEALEEAAVAEGLDRETARTLAVQTAKGAAILAESRDEAPAGLRTEVTSPGGTTAQGVAALERGGARPALADAVAAAARRSRELGD
ncbi:pyrroline-5-carboxylate reductase [Thiohalorhabdus sp.]|uniref:pyrroline-5-carboxylate reductase n=1 Tax=Thiohalorhabdus sp. TaxID=3094134 RepID=UPI002FC2E03F